MAAILETWQSTELGRKDNSLITFTFCYIEQDCRGRSEQFVLHRLRNREAKRRLKGQLCQPILFLYGGERNGSTLQILHARARRLQQQHQQQLRCSKHTVNMCLSSTRSTLRFSMIRLVVVVVVVFLILLFVFTFYATPSKRGPYYKLSSYDIPWRLE